jgi:simple sugar transport system ATP-binding protein
VNEAKRRGLAVIFITHQVMHAMTVGDHFTVLIRGAIAADFRKGEKTREEIADLMAGGEAMADLEASIEGYMESHAGNPPPVA